MASFDSPFRHSELVGWFTWTDELTETLHKSLSWAHHACHEPQLRQFHRRRKLFLRSTFEVRGGRDESPAYECIWLSLQAWHETHGHNHFGPLTVKLPAAVLNDRRFYVFQRKLRDWTHYYLVQRETKRPLFGASRMAERMNPRTLFAKGKKTGRLMERDHTQYELVLTDPVPLGDAQFIATAHNKCVPRACGGLSEKESRLIIRGIVREEIQKLAKQFPQWKRTIAAACP